MDGFDPTFQDPSAVRPWKTVAIVGGAALLAVGLIVGAVLFVRGRQSANVDREYLARTAAQLEQTVAGCASQTDPDACRERAVQNAVGTTGQASLCDQLDGAARDECVWSVAHDQDDASLCAAISDATKAIACEDAILLKQALASLDAGSCEGISDADKKASCLEAVAGPLTQRNCHERESEEYCAQFDLLVQAKNARNPDLCAAISDADLASMCVDAVFPGDRDDDGLDGEEEALHGSSDTSADTDGDGLSDADEVNAYESDPANPDTDGDGYPDGSEVQNGYNPNGAGTL